MHIKHGLAGTVRRITLLAATALLTNGCTAKAEVEPPPPTATATSTQETTQEEEPAATESSDDAQAPAFDLLTAIHRASTVQLARVTGFEDVDDRPMDGNYQRQFQLEIMQVSGTPHDSLHAIIAYGGNWGRPYPPLPTKFTKDSLQVGQAYWFLLGTDVNYSEYTYPIMAWWPQNEAPADITRLVQNDAYNWKPIYHADSGVTYGFDVVSPTKWKLIVKRGPQLLWDRIIDNPVAGDANENNIPIHQGPNFDIESFENVGDDERIYVIYPISYVTLESENHFHMPPGRYRIRQGLEVTDGRLLAEWVLPEVYPNDPKAIRQYHRETGKLKMAARIEFLENGGLAAGSDKEQWLRKILTRYDPEGNVTAQETFRHGRVVDGEYSYNGWVPVASP